MHLIQIGPDPFPQEPGLRSKRFLLKLSALLNKGHISTGTAGRGYFQPFGQENRESQPATREQNGERVPEKDETEKEGFPFSPQPSRNLCKFTLLLSLSLPLESMGGPSLLPMASIFA